MSGLEELHQDGTFLLVNVHDAAAAALAESAGAQALGTTSSGLAYGLGRADGAGLISFDEVLASVTTMRAVTSLPISVDAENGWAHDPEGVAETIRRLVDVGVDGASIEDWSGDESIGFYDRQHALERVQAAIEAAPDGFVINARAEAYLYADHLDDPSAAFDVAVDRLAGFAELGAGCVYAPGPTDETTVRALVGCSPAPLNMLIGVGSTVTMADAAAWGVRRVSVGGSLYRAMMGWFEEQVRSMIDTGRLDQASPLPNGRFGELFER